MSGRGGCAGFPEIFHNVIPVNLAEHGGGRGGRSGTGTRGTGTRGTGTRGTSGRGSGPGSPCVS
jgi:hypothetical protein